MLLYSFAVNVIMLYLGGIFLGIGFSWTTTTMVGYVVNVWCSKNKGTIMGLVLASNGLGGALAMQIVSPIIESSEVGFKLAYGIIAIILAIDSTPLGDSIALSINLIPTSSAVIWFRFP